MFQIWPLLLHATHDTIDKHRMGEWIMDASEQMVEQNSSISGQDVEALMITKQRSVFPEIFFLRAILVQCSEGSVLQYLVQLR